MKWFSKRNKESSWAQDEYEKELAEAGITPSNDIPESSQSSTFDRTTRIIRELVEGSSISFSEAYNNMNQYSTIMELRDEVLDPDNTIVETLYADNVPICTCVRRTNK